MDPISTERVDRTGTAAKAPARGRATLLRWVVALAVVVSGVVHFVLWRDGMRDVDVVGPAFLVNAVAGVAIGVALVAWRHWLPLLAAVGFGAATFGAYLMSMTVGFFGVREQGWTTAAVISAITEVTAVVLGLVALLVERRRA